MSRGHSIGDGLIVLSLALAFLGYTYFTFRQKQRYLEILHQERLVAMERDIPLPELPLEPLFLKTERPTDPQLGVLIGAVLLAFGLGTMLMLWLLPGARLYWSAPLPIAFIGGGLVIAYRALAHSGRGR